MTTQQDERQALAAMLARDSEDVIPDGYLRTGETVDGRSQEEGGITLEDLAFKGYVKVWDNRTGVMSLQPKWLLWQTFTLKREDGSYIFTDQDPHIPQDYGEDLVCLLHPDSPDADILRGKGFKPCLKKHTPTKQALDDHMRLSHKRAYVVMANEMGERRRREDRELQMETIRSNQELIRIMAGQAATVSAPVAVQEAPLYVSDKPKKPKRASKKK